MRLNDVAIILTIIVAIIAISTFLAGVWDPPQSTPEPTPTPVPTPTPTPTPTPIPVQTPTPLYTPYTQPPTNNPPTAFVDSINPNHARQEQSITFSCHGDDPDSGDYITEYKWVSSIDGFLSDKKTFSISSLTSGLHQIILRVKDSHGQWSSEITRNLRVEAIEIPSPEIDDTTPEPSITPTPTPSTPLLPELYVSEFSLDPSTPIQGSPVSVRVGVYNQGNDRSGVFTVQWWAGEIFKEPACTWQVDSLAARGGRILTCTYDGYRSWYGKLTTKVVVDSAEEVAESNEENNEYRKTIRVSCKSTPTPKTHSTGLLTISQTWTADLDEGEVGAGTDSDIWFEAVTATERYITPRNGATIAKVGTTSVGLEGCMEAPLSSSRINIKDLPEGTYVCVRTNLGRYSQFRVNEPVGPSPGTLNIGYTTWEVIP